MKRKKLWPLLRDEDGNILILTALLIAIFVGMLAFVLDLGHVHNTRYELQNAADAGALAGARALFPLNLGAITETEPPNCCEAMRVAKEVTEKNYSDATQVKVDIDLDIILGYWDWNQNTFTPKISGTGSCTNCTGLTFNDINAVKVVAKRLSSGENPPVPMTLAKVFGVDTVDVAAFATAAVGSLREYCYPWPISLCQGFYNKLLETTGAAVYETLTLQTSQPEGKKNSEASQPDEGGWAAPCGENPTPSQLRPMILGTSQYYCLEPGNCVELQEGVTDTLKAVKEKLDQLRQTAGTANDQWNHECNGVNYQGWLLLLPVVPECVFHKSQTNWQLKPIVINYVYLPNDKDLPEECSKSQKHCVKVSEYPCEVSVEGRGSQGFTQTYSVEPKIVQ